MEGIDIVPPDDVEEFVPPQLFLINAPRSIKRHSH
jgi:hypothetical protein